LNDTRSASLCWGTMSKSNMCICSPLVELKLLSRNCLYFLIHPRKYSKPLGWILKTVGWFLWQTAVSKWISSRKVSI
jgi:hypothetical protein